MTLFEDYPPTPARSALHAAAKSRRSLQRNGLRYGPAENDIRTTPDGLFRQFDDEFGFTLDVAALPDNAKCDRFYTPDDNDLTQPWAPDRCWMNPPYSDIEPWTKKALAESQDGALVVALLPVRTDLLWFHRDVLAAGAEIRFVRGRIRFGRHGIGLPMWVTAPHPSMIVVWSPNARSLDDEASSGSEA